MSHSLKRILGVQSVLLICLLTCSGADISSERIVTGLRKPVEVLALPDSNRLLLAEQHTGQIRVIADGQLLAQAILDLNVRTGNEEGLLGMALHPDFANDRRLFIYYNPSGGSRRTVVRSYEMTANGGIVNGTARDLLSIPQPESNHNGGWIGFGPDGFLYIASGDGGGGGDQHGSIGNGQATATLLGKILRIDINVPAGTPDNPPYRIPASNPTLPGRNNNGAPAAARAEIFAYGLRNPWRCSFDSQTGDLFIGDVGQGQREEISVNPAGASGLNFGWKIFEGTRQFSGSDPGGLTPPVHEYGRSVGRSVIGGLVYRGSALPDLRGRYLYADYVTGTIRSFRLQNGQAIDHQDHSAVLADGPGSIDSPAAFGLDHSGHILICDHADGELWRIVANTNPGTAPSITSQPARHALINQTWTYTVALSGDPAPTLRLEQGPSGMQLQGNRLSWTPASTGSTRILLRASNGINPEAEQSFTITVSDVLAAEPVTEQLTNGLHRYRYNGSFSTIPDMNGLTADEARVVTTLAIPGEDHYALRWVGWLSVPETATYRFRLGSDDGSQLFIGGQAVIDNDGLHGFRNVDGEIGLAAGLHYFDLRYIEATGTERVTLQWAQGNAPLQTIPAAAFRRPQTAYGHERGQRSQAYLNFPPSASGTMPSRLSQTGAFVDISSLRPAPGIIPYGVQAPLWSDGAEKERWLAVPDSGITFSARGNWSFPAGTVIIKHFKLADIRLETRFLIVGPGGSVYGLTYRWRDDGSDADLLDAGASRTITTAQGQQTWVFPSRQDCLSCHTAVSGRILGVRTRQLNGTLTYPSTGHSDQQLRSWLHLQLFNNPPSQALEDLDSLPTPGDTSHSLSDRSRAYLDANCMHCHQPDGPGRSELDLRWTTPLADQGMIEAPVLDALGITAAKVIARGSTARSILWQRLSRTDAHRMPPLGRELVDQAAVNLLAAWIRELDDGPPAAPGGLQARPID